jgi:hypothetical protein
MLTIVIPASLKYQQPRLAFAPPSTATPAMLALRLRLRRLNHSRNRASLRSTLMATSASSHRAMLLPALVMLPSR